jgi:hypothetical protein
MDPTRMHQIVARQTETLDRSTTDESPADGSHRIEEIRRACRSAMRALAIRPDRDRLAEYRDPVPQSTLDALQRLRRAARDA